MGVDARLSLSRVTARGDDGRSAGKLGLRLVPLQSIILRFLIKFSFLRFVDTELGLLFSVAPDAIHHHVKTCNNTMKNIHFIAPEYGGNFYLFCTNQFRLFLFGFVVHDTPAVDVYSFGMCALEMAALEIQGNGDSGTLVTDDHINRTIDSLDDPRQKDFIRKCLDKDHLHRPNARELLFHPLLFEVRFWVYLLFLF